jgi:hypothetical protein
VSWKETDPLSLHRTPAPTPGGTEGTPLERYLAISPVNSSQPWLDRRALREMGTKEGDMLNVATREHGEKFPHIEVDEERPQIEVDEAESEDVLREYMERLPNIRKHRLSIRDQSVKKIQRLRVRKSP